MFISYTDDIQNKLIKRRVLCPEYNNFIADHDKIQNSDSEERQEPLLEGIEDCFDVNDHPFMDLMSDPDIKWYWNLW